MYGLKTNPASMSLFSRSTLSFFVLLKLRWSEHHLPNDFVFGLYCEICGHSLIVSLELQNSSNFASHPILLFPLLGSYLKTNCPPS